MYCSIPFSTIESISTPDITLADCANNPQRLWRPKVRRDLVNKGNYETILCSLKYFQTQHTPFKRDKLGRINEIFRNRARNNLIWDGICISDRQLSFISITENVDEDSGSSDETAAIEIVLQSEKPTKKAISSPAPVRHSEGFKRLDTISRSCWK